MYQGTNNVLDGNSNVIPTQELPLDGEYYISPEEEEDSVMKVYN